MIKGISKSGINLSKEVKYSSDLNVLFTGCYTARKMKFSIKDFFSKYDQIRKTADLVTFTEEILN